MTKEEFEQSVEQIMEYMRKNYHPHTTIIVTSAYAEIVEGIQVIQNKKLKDDK